MDKALYTFIRGKPDNIKDLSINRSIVIEKEPKHLIFVL